MIRRLKNLFRSSSKNKNEDPGRWTEKRDDLPTKEPEIDKNEEDAIAFESLIEKALEKYNSLQENGENTEKPDPEMAVIEKEFEEKKNNLPIPLRMVYYPDTKLKIHTVLKNIAEIISGSNCETTNPIDRARNLYDYIFHRSLFMRPEEVLLSTTTFSGNFDIPKEVLTACTAEALGYIYIANPKIGAAGLGSILANREARKIRGYNVDIENRWLDDKKYGLVPQKPIFVKGFGPHRDYLDRLCTEDGKELTYERRGSIQVKEIEGPVDIYDLFYPGGKKYKTIYLCVYGNANSETAPRGMKLK
jgi:hypothetical protein